MKDGKLPRLSQRHAALRLRFGQIELAQNVPIPEKKKQQKAEIWS